MKQLNLKPAQRKKAKSRICITGASGSGKTMAALLIAHGLGGKIAVIDTENASASLYAGSVWCPQFDSLELAPPFAPETFIEAIDAAEKAGYDIIIIDSASHEWNGSGGCLEINDQVAQTRFRGNTWSAWSETTPRHRRFIDKMLQSKCHIITTLRSKTDTTQQDNNGKKTVVKLGLKSEQRDGIEYEFTAVLDLIHDGHWAVASKDRTGLFSQPEVINKETGERLRDWLEMGVDVEALEKAAYQKSLTAVCQAQTIDELKTVWTQTSREHQIKINGLKDFKKFDLMSDSTVFKTENGWQVFEKIPEPYAEFITVIGQCTDLQSLENIDVTLPKNAPILKSYIDAKRGEFL